MADLIDRQAAIDAVEKESQVDGAYGYMDTKSIIDLLNDMPSAQPEVLAHGEGELSAQSEPCEDAVSRKAVEEMLKNGFPARGMWEIEGDVVKQTVCETLADALMDLERLPSAEPERKKGRWIKHVLKNANVPWGYDCSACEWWFVINEEAVKRYNFCPNCGADMRGPEDG